MSEDFLLIEASSFIWRAFHARPERRRTDGFPVHAVEGFIQMVLRPLVERSTATHVAVVFDAPSPTFRHLLYPGYKAHRPPPPPDLVAQIPLVRTAVKAFGFQAVESTGFEADDVIATLTHQAVARGARVTISTTDKDMMQLVGPNVRLYDQQNKRLIGVPEVAAKFGVRPDQVVCVQALCGDSADGIPGVPKIGPKTAAELIGLYGDLEGVLAAAPGLKKKAIKDSLLAHVDDARLSRLLAYLRTDADLKTPLDAMRIDTLVDPLDFLEAEDLFLSGRPRSSKRFPDWRPT